MHHVSSIHLHSNPERLKLAVVDCLIDIFQIISDYDGTLFTDWLVDRLRARPTNPNPNVIDRDVDKKRWLVFTACRVSFNAEC